MVGRKTHVHCELMCSKLPPIKKATNTENYIPCVVLKMFHGSFVLSSTENSSSILQSPTEKKIKYGCSYRIRRCFRGKGLVLKYDGDNRRFAEVTRTYTKIVHFQNGGRTSLERQYNSRWRWCSFRGMCTGRMQV